MPEPEVGGRGHGLGGRHGHFITRKLLDDELVERFVGVQRVDHVIAIPPDERLLRIALVAVAVRVAHDIQPVPGPALTISRSRQKFIDDRGERPRRSVLQEAILLGRRGWQAGQIEIDPPEQRARLGGRSGLPAASLQASNNKVVDRIARTRGALDHWHGGPEDGLKRPMLCRRLRNRLIGRKLRARGDPRL